MAGMRERYFEVTYLGGRPIAAYLYLPRNASDVSARTERRTDGLLIDFASDGRAIGVEITAPQCVSLSALNDVLMEVDQQPATIEELAPVTTG